MGQNDISLKTQNLGSLCVENVTLTSTKKGVKSIDINCFQCVSWKEMTYQASKAGFNFVTKYNVESDFNSKI